MGFRIGLLLVRHMLGNRVWHFGLLLFHFFLLLQKLEEFWVIEIIRLHIIIDHHRLLLLCRRLGLDFDVFDVLRDFFYFGSPLKVGGGLLDVRRFTGLDLE